MGDMAVDMTDDTEALEQPPRVDTPGSSASTVAKKALREEEDRDVKEWLETIASGGAIKVLLVRTAPRMHKGVPTEGTVATYTEPVTEEEIQADHGGGTYQLKILRPNAQGIFKFFTSRVIRVPGYPNIVNLAGTEEASGGRVDPVVDRAMTTLERSAREDRERSTKLERERETMLRQNNSGFDPKVLEVMNAPFMEQIRSLQADRSAIDAKLTTLMTAKPDTTFQERMLDKMTDESGKRLDALRTQFDSERRVLLEGHKSDLDRVHDSYAKQFSAMEKAHEREVGQLKLSYDGQLLMQKTSFETRIDGLNREIARLDKELTKAEAANVTLSAKKDKSFIDSAKELVSMKDTLEELGLGGDDEKPGWMEKLMDNPAAEKIAAGIASRLAGAEGPAQQDPMMQMIQSLPIGKWFKLPTGQVVMRQADGQVVVAQQRRKKKRTPEQAAKVEKAKKTEAANLDPTEVKAAIGFIETAIRNGTEPNEFAQSIATMVPAGIRKLLKQKGVDYFLNEVADIDEGSPLYTQNGRNFMRSVARALVEGE